MSVLWPPTTTSEPAEIPARLKLRRSWRDKFGDALRGCKLGIRGHSSFSVHFFFAALGRGRGRGAGLRTLEWCLLLGCIGLVLTAELFNSAVETLFHGLDESTKAARPACLDIAAGAVLAGQHVRRPRRQPGLSARLAVACLDSANGR